MSGRGGREEAARTKLRCPVGTYPDKLKTEVLERSALPPQETLFASIVAWSRRVGGAPPGSPSPLVPIYFRHLVSISQLISGDEALLSLRAGGWVFHRQASRVGVGREKGRLGLTPVLDSGGGISEELAKLPAAPPPRKAPRFQLRQWLQFLPGQGCLSQPLCPLGQIQLYQAAPGML